MTTQTQVKIIPALHFNQQVKSKFLESTGLKGDTLLANAWCSFVDTSTTMKPVLGDLYVTTIHFAFTGYDADTKTKFLIIEPIMNLLEIRKAFAAQSKVNGQVVTTITHIGSSGKPNCAQLVTASSKIFSFFSINFQVDRFHQTIQKLEDVYSTKSQFHYYSTYSVTAPPPQGNMHYPQANIPFHGVPQYYPAPPGYVVPVPVPSGQYPPQALPVGQYPPLAAPQVTPVPVGQSPQQVNNNNTTTTPMGQPVAQVPMYYTMLGLPNSTPSNATTTPTSNTTTTPVILGSESQKETTQQPQQTVSPYGVPIPFQDGYLYTPMGSSFPSMIPQQPQQQIPQQQQLPQPFNNMTK